MKKLFSIFFIITFPQYFTQKENEKKKIPPIFYVWTAMQP